MRLAVRGVGRHPRPVAVGPARGRSRSILLLSNDLRLAGRMRARAARVGCELTAVPTIGRALAEVQRSRPDLIAVDDGTALLNVPAAVGALRRATESREDPTDGTAAVALRFAGTAPATDVGRVRAVNEDRLVAGPALVAVADGMGGGEHGGRAAQRVVDALAAAGPPVSVASARSAIEEANRVIHAERARHLGGRPMATTVTAALLEGGALRVLHVGDSRAYLWRDGRLRQLTDDHSMVGELMRRGVLSAHQAAGHPQRSVLSRALGAEPEVHVDVVARAARAGDVVLVCTDGVSAYVADDEIAATLRDALSLADAASRLLGRADEAGGHDNASVVLARVGAPGAEGAAAGSAAGAPEPAPEDAPRVLILSRAPREPSGPAPGADVLTAPFRGPDLDRVLRRRLGGGTPRRLPVRAALAAVPLATVAALVAVSMTGGGAGGREAGDAAPPATARPVAGGADASPQVSVRAGAVAVSEVEIRRSGATLSIRYAADRPALAVAQAAAGGAVRTISGTVGRGRVRQRIAGLRPGPVTRVLVTLAPLGGGRPTVMDVTGPAP